MQCAGHTVGQHMHATQRTAPSSRSIRRCRPRNRSGYVDLLLGVLHGLDLVAPRLVDRRAGARVAGLLQRQEQVAREVLERDAEALRGRREERRVLRHRPHDLDRADARVAIGDRDDVRALGVVVLERRRRGRRTSLTSHEHELDQRGHHDVRERERQQQLPAEVHQLIGAEPRQRPAQHQLEPAQQDDLAAERGELEQRDDAVRQLGRPSRRSTVTWLDRCSRRSGSRRRRGTGPASRRRTPSRSPPR